MGGGLRLIGILRVVVLFLFQSTNLRRAVSLSLWRMSLEDHHSSGFGSSLCLLVSLSGGLIDIDVVDTHGWRTFLERLRPRFKFY